MARRKAAGEGAGGSESVCPFCGGAVRGDAPARLVAGRGRRLQATRTGERKLFGKQRKETFLQWMAMTGNLGLAAKQAGVCRQTVSKHRLSDPEFEENYRRAIALGLPDLQAKLIRHGKAEAAVDLAGGDAEAADAQPFDPQLALQILREQQRMAEAGSRGPGEARKRGRRPRIATNAEVKTALLKALVAFGKRVTAERQA